MNARRSNEEDGGASGQQLDHPCSDKFIIRAWCWLSISFTAGAVRCADSTHATRVAHRASRITHDGAFIGIPTPRSGIRAMPMAQHDAASS
ncbi:hypothetical protein [Burkholderia ambifaria]|uniref:hypothetical protein n=1 Tax=Burkholderia ambifaria TaxID=152480 RepID=UPI0015891BDA|nr:hypothetical protein [Burkholderia ambifaria]MBR8345134.1 hypothetical protein [Burkholderia ambifaria]